MTRLSVIMPMHNAARTVAIAVRSTLRALDDTAELVIYDDASTDRSVDVVNAIGDPRIRLVRGETQIGVAAGLNTLLGLVESPWIARMDADDICLPWRFRVQRRRSLSTRSEVVFGSVVSFVDGRPLPRPNPPVAVSPEAMTLHLVLGNPVAHSTMYGRLDRIREVGGYRAVTAEDYDLWLRLATAGARLTRAAAPVILYRLHPQQVTASEAWSRRPPLEPGVDRSYAEHCSRFLGVEPSWFPNPRRNRQPRADLLAMRSAVLTAGTGLPARERRFLARKATSLLRFAAETPD